MRFEDSAFFKIINIPFISILNNPKQNNENTICENIHLLGALRRKTISAINKK